MFQSIQDQVKWGREGERSTNVIYRHGERRGEM